MEIIKRLQMFFFLSLIHPGAVLFIFLAVLAISKYLPRGSNIDNILEFTA